MFTAAPRLRSTVIILALAAGLAAPAAAQSYKLKVLAEPLHAGRISPLLHGNFMELLDDLIPGMWAEMLGNRGFEGVLPASNWDYHKGALNLMDRDWDPGDSWALDTEKPWNALKSARVTAAPARPGRLEQSALAVKKGMSYRFSGWFRSGSAALKMTVLLKAALPDGSWMTLGTLLLPAAPADWAKREGTLVSSGTTDRAVFELRLEGAGAIWADKLSLMPADAIEGWRKDAVEAIREMRPPIVRWGGSTVDPGGYQWKQGVGERDRRLPFRNPVWGRLDTMDVGIEEFIRFCRIVDAEPLLCVSLKDGPASAREMVEYVNGAAGTPWGAKRAANGHPAPYGVKYWQVGNEIDDPSYPARCLEFCKAVKEADPSAAIFTSFPTPELIDKVKDYVDFYSPHYYQSDLQGVDEDLRRISGLIREKSPGRPAKLAVTEWNIDAGAWGLGRGKLDTLGCALFEAQFLNLLHRNSDVVGAACRSNMCNSFCGGTIQTNAAGLFRIPSFYVLKMFSERSRPVPLRISALPVGLDATACASEDRRALTVFLVNTRKEPLEIEIDPYDLGAQMAAAGGQTIGDAQDRRQMDVSNSWDRPDRVRPMPLAPNGRTFRLPAFSVTAVEFAVR